MNLFDEISSWPSLHARHGAAPLLREREQYLATMLKRGVSRIVVRSTAAYLIHIVRLLKMSSLRKVELNEIEAAGRGWAAYEGPLRKKLKRPGSPFMFVRIAQSWLRFHGQLPALPPSPFQPQIEEFTEAMRIRGLSTATVEARCYRLLTFVRWFGDQHQSLDSISLRHIDEYFAIKGREGWSVGTIATNSQALRSFFSYASLRGWCAPGIALGIQSPKSRRSDNRPKGPKWTEVRRLIASASGSSPSDLRAKAVLLLFAIYGLRSSEVAQLRFSDFDWCGETFTVHRAKRGGIQQFPIQYEVGEAIIRYLQHGRPRSATDYVFVAAQLPHGLIRPGPMHQLVTTRMLALGIKPEQLGPHSLRHACATRLLKKGTSLREIADFLGHRNLKTVSIYARLDTRALRKVASFSMAGVL
jgi:site-specific recombinase XerD